MVAPRAGAWIETFDAEPWITEHQSLPVRERGLKQTCRIDGNSACKVAPRAGAWIETVRSRIDRIG